MDTSKPRSTGYWEKPGQNYVYMTLGTSDWGLSSFRLVSWLSLKSVLGELLYRWASFSNLSMRKSELSVFYLLNSELQICLEIFFQLYCLKEFSLHYHHCSRSPYCYLEKMQELSNRSPYFWSLTSHICPTHVCKINFLDPQSLFTLFEEFSIYCRINICSSV